jgi:hypothetical protein
MLDSGYTLLCFMALMAQCQCNSMERMLLDELASDEQYNGVLK